MLRNSKQASLDAIIKQCREAADLYRQAAELAAGGQNPAGLFRRLADRRDQVAAELEAHLRALGDLPGEPDRDREAVAEILTRLKSALAADKRLELLEERRQAEAALAARAEKALALEYPEEMRATLAALREEAARAEKELQAAAEAIAAGRGLDE
jgi:DNA repair ATPase RecN